MTHLGQLADVVRATRSVKVASGIIAIHRFGAPEVAALYHELEASHPGRLVVGLGGAPGPDPIAAMAAFLDELGDTVPPSATVLAALGPRNLRLARERAAAAFPVLVTPDYTAQARATLGADTTLAVEQLVVLGRDGSEARALARQPLGFLASMPAYQANFRRMGFGDDDINTLSDRLVDALVPWGDAATLARHVEAQRAAGADHVAVSIVSASNPPTVEEWRELAGALIPPGR